MLLRQVVSIFIQVPPAAALVVGLSGGNAFTICELLKQLPWGSVTCLVRRQISGC